MIDLLYSYRKRGYKLADVKDHILAYSDAIKQATGSQFFDGILAGYNYTTGSIDDLIKVTRDEIKKVMYNCRLQRGGQTVAVSKSFGEISKLILNSYHTDVSNHGGVKADYVFHYAMWLFTALDDIFSCIAYNGSISTLEYVGYRTNQYLNTLKLDKVAKRFGTPCDRNAYPISFYNGTFSLSGPPMTTAAHTREYIRSVYQFFGYSDFYEINIGKTLFTRCVNFRQPSVSHVPIDIFKKHVDLIDTYKDINPSFVYDYFVATYIARMTNQIVNEDLVLASFPNTLNSVISINDNFLYKLKLEENVVSLGELITLVY